MHESMGNVAPGHPGTTIRFTLRWSETEQWEGADFGVTVTSVETDEESALEELATVL